MSLYRHGKDTVADNYRRINQIESPTTKYNQN